jgi:glucosylceramidase
MPRTSLVLFLCALTVGAAFAQNPATPASASAAPRAELWVTHPDRSALFQKQDGGVTIDEVAQGRRSTLTLNEKKTYQTIDGFGFSLTQGSAMLISKMSPAKRAELLQELFGRGGNAIGISYLRVSIGASDLNEYVFSYNDLPEGETDFELKKFELGPDRKDVIPVLKEILAINPSIPIMGSPWSAPTWMKTNREPKAGRLRPECYDVYARYFVKYIEAMRAEGIRIDAVTIQNEPLHDGNLPSMFMLAEDQAKFVRENLGPAFKSAGLDTKIIVWDHNCNHPEYPISILKDPGAYPYVDGSGFHLYEGTIDAMSEVHRAFPEKNLYFTEQMVTEQPGSPTINIGVPVRRIMFGALRNWSRNVLLWNLAADPLFDPHTDHGGCGICQGAITIDGDKVERNIAYYTIAHFSKFVPPGSVRIESGESDTLPNVAFKTPDGGAVVVVLNNGWAQQRVNVRHQSRQYAVTLQAGTVATLVIKAP